MIGFWRFTVVLILLMIPVNVLAQGSQRPTAEARLPRPDSLDVGRTVLSSGTPADLAAPFRDAAVATYGGPNGARVSVAVLLVNEGMKAIRDSWELGNTYFETYQSNTDYGYDSGRERDLDEQEPPAGCADARRTYGVDQALGSDFPVGITLCAADPDAIVLVYASGEVNGQTGYQASDFVVELVLSGVITDAPVAADDSSATFTPVRSRSVEIVSIDITFEPKALTIPADSDVTVSLPNGGVTAHNFSIDELDVSVDLQPGTTEEVVLNAPAGTYEYYCNVPGHKAAGMVGTLNVE